MTPELPTPDDLRELLQRFRQQQAGRWAENQAAEDQAIEVLLGESPAMVQLRAQLEVAASSRANTLIKGPSGWELQELARAIHYRAHPDGQAPLVRLEGGVVRSDDLRRAFSPSATGSVQRGTLLIDSIDQLPPAQQAELLAGLNHPAWQGQLVATLDKRSKETANEKLASPISDELRAATATLTLQMPPLASRPEDLPLLAQGYVEQIQRKSGSVEATFSVGGFTNDALDHLVLYDWPGELEELRRVVSDAYQHCKGATIDSDDLPAVVHHALRHAELAQVPLSPISLDDYLAKVESTLLLRALELTEGNKTEAARLLSVSRPRLYRRLVHLGLEEAPESTPPDQSTQSTAETKSTEKTKSTEVPQPSSGREEIEFMPIDPTEDDPTEEK